ncbi:hypothetical protein BD311DRAFT_816357 [Dichomitus squalens]|uniref:Uncharacterized protein n=1 Tax=Dichomitus squalens TaxID=114155 RepID=A0A4Q9MA06_9APHY|nr:hypothetical protein BD311DRAFT_816357 [Dichomitus squalens]
MCESDEEYEPSQIVGDRGLQETLFSRRTRRSEVERGIAERRTSRLFASGGALDSQTSETQFIQSLEEPEAATDVVHNKTYMSTGVQTDPAREHRLQQINSFVQENTDLFLDPTQESQTLIDMAWLTDEYSMVTPTEDAGHETRPQGKHVREDDVGSDVDFERGHFLKVARRS